MTVEKIRHLLRSSPFQSFEVHTPDGRAFKVPHPGFAMLSVAVVTDIAIPAKA